MTPETSAKKDIQKLQRAIVDGLEDVKAQDIQVFNTEHLSPLFERVVVASGTSNRQTRALASSVVDAVRDAGFGKPRLEGQDNGEWIIVDCGAAVVHVMQPAIRQYYQLEDIWGDKPVRLRLGAPKPAAPAAAAKAPAGKSAGAGKGKAAGTARPATAGKTTAKLAPAKPDLRGRASAKPVSRTAPTAAPTAAPKAAPKAATRAAPKATPKAASKAVAKAAPLAKPVTKVVGAPATRPATRPAGKGSAKPPAKSAARAAARPAAGKSAASSAAKPARKGPARKA